MQCHLIPWLLTWAFILARALSVHSVQNHISWTSAATYLTHCWTEPSFFIDDLNTCGFTSRRRGTVRPHLTRNGTGYKTLQ